MSEDEKELVSLMTAWYNSEEKALIWYDKPNPHLGLTTGDSRSPRELMESGELETLMTFVRNCIAWRY